MTRIPPAPIEGNNYERVMGHRPEILTKWFELDSLMRFSGMLSPHLKEEVRRSLAPGVGCVFCASLGRAADEHPDVKESLAIAFAQQVFEQSLDLENLDASVFDVLREEFSDEEIVELTCWVLFMIAAQGFGAVMKLAPAPADQIDAYTQWRRDGEAAAAVA